MQLQADGSPKLGETSSGSNRPLRRLKLIGRGIPAGMAAATDAAASKQPDFSPTSTGSGSSCSSRSHSIPGCGVNAGFIHNDFCEVCQKSGRLLLCDTCPKAFHAQCIQRLIDSDDLVQCTEWSCPVCRHGEQILRGQKRLKLTPAQMETRMQEMVAANKRQHRLAVKRRDLLLTKKYDLVEPFISKSTQGRLLKQAGIIMMPLLPIGAHVRVKELQRGMHVYEATVLAQTSSTRYVVAEVSTGKEAEVDRVQLSEVTDAPRGGVSVDFLNHAREQVLSEGTKLKDYQAVGVNWMLRSFYNQCGGILADDMGLGKTVQTLAMLSWLQSSGSVKGPFLVVVPLSCAGNWIREAKRFVPHMSIAKVCGAAKEKENSLDDDEIWFGLKDIIITTYETVKAMDEFFQRHFWSVIVLDEAHRIKSQFTATRQVLDTFTCSSRLLLTGTPLQNNLGELFELLRFLWPDVYSVDSEVFSSAGQLPLDFFDSIGRPENLEEDPSTEAAAHLPLLKKVRSLLEMVMLRRRKQEVITLPPKVIYDIWLPIAPCQAEWYKALLKCRRSAMRLGARALLKLLLRLRLICAHPRCMVTNENARDMFYKECPDLDGAALKRVVEAPMSEDVIAQSGKLVFLDKLLGHLHAQNMGFSTEWRKAFEERTRKLHKTPRRTASAWLKGADGLLFLDEMSAWRPAQRSGGDERNSSSSAGQAADKSFERQMPDADAEKGPPQPHKVLIFTQYRATLDILEQFCAWRGWRSLRLDGSTHRVLRELDIRDFNCSEEDYFVYLIGTRAGGLGINLASANHVVLFDQDWNPHVDHQAIDRAHRIGQNRKVTIYKLVQEWTVEERLIHRQEQKLKMEQCVIDKSSRNIVDGEEDPGFEVKERLSAEEVIMLLKHGEHTLKHFAGEIYEGVTLHSLLERPRRPLLLTEVEEDGELPEGLRGVVVEDDVAETASKGPSCELDDFSTPGQHGVSAVPPAPPHSTDLEPAVRMTSSGRIIKPPTSLYDSQAMEKELQQKKKPKRPPLQHFSQCFVCGEGPCTHRKRGRLHENEEDDLLEAAPCDLLCDQCPKAFHSTCLRMDGTDSSAGVWQGRNRWVCGWHFCALCGRNSSSCGGMLMHCVECPSALCYDCFPPNFRRVHPPLKFWADLNSKNYKATAQKMVFFKCNTCRALEEQQRRQEMRREDLEAQQDEKKRAALEEKRSFAERQKQKEDEEARRRMRQLIVEHERTDLQQKIDSARLAIEEGAEKLWPASCRRQWLALCADEDRERPAKTMKGGRNDKMLPVKLCRNCSFPGHLVQDCPEPRERTLERKAVDADAKETAPRKRPFLQYCSLCKKVGHGRLQCPSLTVEQLKSYEERLEDLNCLAKALRETMPITEKDSGILGAEDTKLVCERVKAAVQSTICELLKRLGLGRFVVERSKPELGQPKAKSKAKAKAKATFKAIGKAKAKAQARVKLLSLGILRKRKRESLAEEGEVATNSSSKACTGGRGRGRGRGRGGSGGDCSGAANGIHEVAKAKAKAKMWAKPKAKAKGNSRNEAANTDKGLSESAETSSAKKQPNTPWESNRVLAAGLLSGWTIGGSVSANNRCFVRFQRPANERWLCKSQALQGLSEAQQSVLEEEFSKAMTELRSRETNTAVQARKGPAQKQETKTPEATCKKAPEGPSKKSQQEIIYEVSDGDAKFWTVRGKLNAQRQLVFAARPPGGQRFRQAHEGAGDEVKKALETERGRIETQLRMHKEESPRKKGRTLSTGNVGDVECANSASSIVPGAIEPRAEDTTKSLDKREHVKEELEVCVVGDDVSENEASEPSPLSA